MVVDVATTDRMVHIPLAGTGDVYIGFTSGACVFGLGQYNALYFSFVLPAGVQLYAKAGPGDTATFNALVTKSPSSLSLGFCS